MPDSRTFSDESGRWKMRFPKRSVVLLVAIILALPSTSAWGHWCDDLWSSGYDIVVRPDSDTSPQELYVENRWLRAS